ncbi:MAG: TIGR02266 family protein [Kofleriaceae bacterium]
MQERENDRMPFTVQVEFRTASSFLVAYSMNLSRGGMFLETEQDIPIGSITEVGLRIPGADVIHLVGVVAWRRGLDSPEGPPGLGIEFQEVVPQLGVVIDRLVSTFHGVKILVLSGDRQDRMTLSRAIKSIISTSDVLQAPDTAVAATLLTRDIDLAVVDLDFDVEGALKTLRAAKALMPPIPIVAITSSTRLREHARAAGADELATNPPPFAELQVVLVRALSKPVAVRRTTNKPL